MSGMRFAAGIKRLILPARAGVAFAVLVYLIHPAAFWHSPGDLPLVPICAIQGRGTVSPYLGRNVRVHGLVFADLDETSRRGFFIQEPVCDGDPATSDGIFIYTGSRSQVVSVGDMVEVQGLVGEYFGLTEISAGQADISLLSSGNPLPPPTDLDPPADDSLAEIYYESLEGMYVRMPDAIVVGPTNASEETWLVRADLGIERIFQDERPGTGEAVCVDDGGAFRLRPQAKTGDRVAPFHGVLDYSYNKYRLQLLEQPVLAPGRSSYMPAAGSAGFSVATLNLKNLFDLEDDPGTDDLLPSPAEYQRRLGKLALLIHEGLGEPVLLGVQEAENQKVLEDLVSRPEIVADYGVVLLDGPDRRGIDSGFLYRRDRARLLEFWQHQGCTRLVDGLGPDGTGDALRPQNALTCDWNGDGYPDGNRLFARPPLFLRLAVTPCDSGEAACSEELDILVIVNHWKSKSEDTRSVKYTLPRRIEQAEFVASLSRQLIEKHPQSALIVMGDLNDYPDAQPLTILASAGLHPVRSSGNPKDGYTYIYQGISQVLDYILASPNLYVHLLSARTVHANADYPAVYFNQAGTLLRSSDHDPVHAHFLIRDQLLFFPIIAGGS